MKNTKSFLSIAVIFLALFFAGFISFILESNSQLPSPTPIPYQLIQINQINVSINNSLNFTLDIEDGANQCDVLSKALADGKISSLNMKYDGNW